MYDFTISREQAREFAFDCFDVLIEGIRAETEESGDENDNQ